MSYPKVKYSKKDFVVVQDQEQEESLGKKYFDSPVDAKSEFDYEGKQDASKDEEVK